MKRYAGLMVGVVFCAFTAQAEVTVSKVFGDHMVLQRDIDVPVWGWADPGEEATVEFAGQKKSTKACKAVGRDQALVDQFCQTTFKLSAQ